MTGIPFLGGIRAFEASVVQGAAGDQVGKEFRGKLLGVIPKDILVSTAQELSLWKSSILVGDEGDTDILADRMIYDRRWEGKSCLKHFEAKNAGMGLSEDEGRFLTQYGIDLPSVRIAIDPELGEGALATHRFPATVVVREASVPESVIAHELAHIAQGTLEQFRGFRPLHTLGVWNVVCEALVEWFGSEHAA